MLGGVGGVVFWNEDRWGESLADCPVARATDGGGKLNPSREREEGSEKRQSRRDSKYKEGH